MRLLDLFCGAGGAAMGYYRAGFQNIVGVDIHFQPHYPFEFVRADAFAYLAEHGAAYDVIHASPMCQAYSLTKNLPNVCADRYPQQIEPLRKLLQQIGKPYVIENVVGAPLRNPLKLFGHVFGLRVYRPRLFESNLLLFAPERRKFTGKIRIVRSKARGGFQAGDYLCIAGKGNYRLAEGKQAMGIDWDMTKQELNQAVPPAYTEFIGRQLVRMVTTPGGIRRG